MKLVVLGAGESGVGAALLGVEKDYEVFVSDKGDIAEEYRKVLLNSKIEFEEGVHSKERIFDAKVVVKSPGIPDTVPMILELKAKGIPVISEIEFASKFTEATLVGITGSNGKTTTTMLTHHILKTSGMDVGMAGNIGDSFAWQIAQGATSNYVLELSSFQLDGVENFRPHIAVVTNISADHLDRYDYKIENYIASKFRITMNQTKDDFLIYDADDYSIKDWLLNNHTNAQLVPFSIEKELDYGGVFKG